MSIRASAAVVALVCGLGACTPPAHDPPASRAQVPELTTNPTATSDDVYVARIAIQPTQEMLKAAQANDPDAMRDAIALDTTCHATSSPSQFGSCSGWSTSTLCDETYGASFCLCKPIRLCDGEPPEPKGTQTFNSFRVCFDANQNACTEWTNTTTSFCGC